MEGHRQRAQKQLLRVTFSDGTVLCYTSCRETFVQTIKKIGTYRLDEITLEIGHLPIFSKTIYPSMAEYMRKIDDEWYVNLRSDAKEKYLQLSVIKEQLGLDFTVELGSGFETSKTISNRTRKGKESFAVRFPNGYIITDISSREVYVKTMKKIGLLVIKSKSIEALGKELVNNYQKYPTQVEVEKGYWLTIPGTTKDRIKALNSVKLKLRGNFEIIQLTNPEAIMELYSI